ncbi:ribonucleotide-pyrophosphate reductase subunit beta [Rhodococcus sp. P27]|nr:ribonucleotide-pyrophosphate reductase subunit beta [Rhodococcus sp. P27]
MSFVSDAPLPLPGMPDSIPALPAFQMTLIGQPEPVRIPERLWRSWLDNPAVVARFESKRYRRQQHQSWPYRWGVLNRAQVFPRREPAWAVPSQNGAGTFVRLPARIRYSMLTDLYENELRYAHYLYDPLGMTEPVLPDMRYNANKALDNLGFAELFPREQCQVTPEILSSLDPGAAENHDFFSGSGSSYVIGKTEHTTTDDWNW